MAWVRIEDQVPRHPKMLSAGPVACWLWVLGLCYCQHQLTDGFIPDMAVPVLGMKLASRYAKTLVKVGLWERVEGGYRVHDYLAFNDTRATALEKREAAKRAKSEAGKKGMASRWSNNTIITDGDNRIVTESRTPAITPSHPIPSHSIPKEREREKSAPALRRDSLPTRQKANQAFYGRMDVPSTLHRDFIRKLGGAEDEADLQLRAWYRTVDDALGDQEVDEPNEFKFWEREFTKWRAGPKAEQKEAQDLAEMQAEIHRYDQFK